MYHSRFIYYTGGLKIKVKKNKTYNTSNKYRTKVQGVYQNKLNSRTTTYQGMKKVTWVLVTVNIVLFFQSVHL